MNQNGNNKPFNNQNRQNPNFKPGQKPEIRLDILHEIEKRIPGFPIVLHGASSVSQEHVKEINSLGGNLPDAVGIPEEQLRKAASMAVCKINIDSDIRLALTAGIRRVLHNQPDVFDPRTYLTVARAEVKKWPFTRSRTFSAPLILSN